TVSCVAADRKGAIWIGTTSRKLYCRYNNQCKSWDSASGLASHNIVTLLPSATGDLWIGESGLAAVQCLHEGQLRQIDFRGTLGKISSMAEDAAGNIWVGTFKGQLLRVDGDHL